MEGDLRVGRLLIRRLFGLRGGSQLWECQGLVYGGSRCLSVVSVQNLTLKLGSWEVGSYLFGSKLF